MATNASGALALGMIQPLSDPLLQQIKDGIEAILPPDLKDAYLRIIVAGLKIMFSPQTHQEAVNALTQASKQHGPYQAVALGIVTLLSIILRESKGKMSFLASTPAGIVLLCYAFEFVEKQQHLTLTPQIFADATHVVTLGVMKLFGITQEMLAEGVDYAKMATLKQGLAN